MAYSDNPVTERERTAMYTMASTGWIDAALALGAIALDLNQNVISLLVLCAAALLLIQSLAWRARDEFFEALAAIAMRSALVALALLGMALMLDQIISDETPRLAALARIDLVIALVSLVYFASFMIARWRAS